MAGPHQVNLEYLNYKLAFVEKLQSRLFAATTDYINEVQCVHCLFCISEYIVLIFFMCS